MRRRLGLGALLVAMACSDRQVDGPGVGDDGGRSGTGGGSAGSGQAGGTGGFGGAGQGSAGAQTSGSGGSGGAGGPTKPRLVQSGSRLEALVYKGDDGSRHPTGAWFDVQRNEECTFRPAHDGQVRCLPKAVPHVVAGSLPEVAYYADNACAQPAVLVTADCGGPDFGYVSIAEAGACGGPPPRLYQKGAPLASSPLFQRVAGGTCQYRGPAAAGEASFAVGQEVPPASFVGATVERLSP